MAMNKRYIDAEKDHVIRHRVAWSRMSRQALTTTDEQPADAVLRERTA